MKIKKYRKQSNLYVLIFGYWCFRFYTVFLTSLTSYRDQALTFFFCPKIYDIAVFIILSDSGPVKEAKSV